MGLPNPVRTGRVLRQLVGPAGLFQLGRPSLRRDGLHNDLIDNFGALRLLCLSSATIFGIRTAPHRTAFLLPPSPLSARPPSSFLLSHKKFRVVEVMVSFRLSSFPSAPSSPSPSPSLSSSPSPSPSPPLFPFVLFFLFLVRIGSPRVLHLNFHLLRSLRTVHDSLLEIFHLPSSILHPSIFLLSSALHTLSIGARRTGTQNIRVLRISCFPASLALPPLLS